MRLVLLALLLSLPAAAQDFGSGFESYTPPWNLAGHDVTAKSLTVNDTTASMGHEISLIHNQSGDDEATALNISNRSDNAASPSSGVGAGPALMVHQYSDLSPAVQVDNTRSKAAIIIRNARNDTLSTGTRGSGPFFDLWGFTTASPDANLLLGRLEPNLVFSSFDSSVGWAFRSRSTAPSLLLLNTDGGKALSVQQTSAAQAVSISQTGAAVALAITAGSGSAGVYPVDVSGQDYGPRFVTTTDGGQSLEVRKDGTGSGTAVKVTNKGTGHGLSLNNASAEVWFVDSAGSTRQKPLASPGTCSSTVEGLMVTVAGAAGALTKRCICTYDGTTALWVNLLNPSARSGSTTSCPAS